MASVYLHIGQRRPHTFNHFGPSEFLQAICLHEVGHSFLDFYSLGDRYRMVVEILKSIGAQPLTNLLGLAIVYLQSFVGPVDISHIHPKLICNLGGFQFLNVL